jgi:ERCC4-type nuclease
MLQSLDIVSIHITTRVKGKRVRRCKQIIEIIDIDPTTKEILTNEVFRWDPIEDKFLYTGKSYVLEGIRASWDLTKEEITKEIRDRAEILEWMNENNIRTFREVAKVISRYDENPDEFMKKIKHSDKKKKKDINEDKKGAEKEKEIKEKPTKKVQKLIEEHAEEKDLTEIPVIQLEEKQEKDQLESNVDLDYKINAFKDLDTIDDEIAVLLFNNGFTSIDVLKNASVKDLIKIKGIKKKIAKRIKKEIEKNFKKKHNSLKEVKTEEIESSEPNVNIDYKINFFKNIESIDNKTAILLYNNGFLSIEDLKNATLKELIKIKGIKRKIAKKIIKELKDNANIDLSQISDKGGEMGAS